MTRLPLRISGLAQRIALLSVAVAFCAVGVIAFGVLVVAQSVFSRLMIEAGASAAAAHAMFEHGVLGIFVMDAAAAVLVSGLLAAVLAARFTRPLQEMAEVARRIAGGDLRPRMVSRQPEELAALAEAFNQMATSLERQEEERRQFVANAAHGSAERRRAAVRPADSRRNAIGKTEAWLCLRSRWPPTSARRPRSTRSPPCSTIPA